MSEYDGRDVRAWITAFRTCGYDAMKAREALCAGWECGEDPYVETDLAFLSQWPVDVVWDGDGRYPASLADDLGRRRPGLFFCMGNTGLLTRPSLLIVGARDASREGCGIARACANEAAKRGWLVESGYARGVDMAAHLGSLESGGDTMAVLPYGLSRFSVRRALGGTLSEESFLAVSELPPSMGFLVKSALRRNRLLVALAAAVIVIEPGESGGTWYTAECVRRAGKPLFFHPGKREEYSGRLEELGGVAIGISDGVPDLEPIADVIDTHR